MSTLFNSAPFLYSHLLVVMLLIGGNAQAATTTAAGFNTTNGTNLTPSVAFGGSDETLTITAAAHVVGSTADGGGGTDILGLSNGEDLTALTSLVNFETLNLADGQNYTMSEVQHDAFTTINSTGTAQIILADSDGDDTVTGASSVEGYTLNDAYTFTLGDATQNVTGNADSNQTVNIAGLAPTGILTGGTGGIDILRASHGANLSAATVSGFETLEVLTFGNLVTLTPAQFNSFTNVSPSSGGGSRSVAFSTSGTLSPSVNVSNTIGYRTVNGGAEVITLSAVQANGKTLVATDTANDNFIVTGSAGDQVLFGSLGNDNLDGGAGEDTLYSAGGADTLTGGSENDAFRGAASELNGDTITDLSAGDTIVITNTPAIGAVRFGASNNTLEVDTDGTDFSSIEVTINLSNTPGTRLVPNLVITTPNGFGQFDISFTASLPTISSATYNGGNGLLTVTGTNFVANSGAANDVDVSLLTITGNGVNARALTSATDVEITNATTFSVTLSGAEKDAVDLLLNKTGTSADDATTYNLSAAEDWMAGASAAADIADLTSNGISVVTAETDALDSISSTANQAGGTPPTVDDYKNVGITDVSDTVLTRILPLINSAVARQSDSADVDEASELQALINAILEGQDNDKDGLPNLVEGAVDSDNDGTADREDTDSDNDGVADQLEIRLALTDSDSDGIIDVLDADVGNDGQVDAGKVDANFDGVNDALDTMAELVAKAAVNSEDGQLFRQFNQDQDLRPNHLDLDSDNDGIMDVVESGLKDINGDGKLDSSDTVITDGSKLLDGDADSLPNMLEVKSDGISFDLSVNGLPNTLDTDTNGILDSTIDMDRDGIIDSVDNAVGAQGTLPDVDNDGIPNHADKDDDGDGIPDSVENTQQQHFTGLDADADGIDDGVDHNINGVLSGTDNNDNGVRDDRELSDMDKDGIADHLDTDSDNDGIPDNQDVVVNLGDDVKSGGAGGMNIMMMLSLVFLSLLRYSYNVLRVSIILLLWLGSTISHAQNWQVNFGLGQSSLDPDLANGLDTRNGNDRAVQLGLGYRFSEDWLLELRYSDLGEADIHGSQKHSNLGYISWGLDTKYQLPLLQGTSWTPYVLGGISLNRLQSDDLNLEKKNDTDLMLGAGISYRFSEFQLNSELIRYSDDAAGWFMGVQKDF